MDTELATPGDVASLHDLARAAFAPYTARIGQAPAPMSEDFAARVAAGAVTLARVEGRIVGYAVTEWRGTTLHIAAFALDPDRQRQGLGGRFLRLLERGAAAAGAARLSLYTNAAMQEARAFYPKQGFLETARRREDGFDRVYFEKPLPGPTSE